MSALEMSGGQLSPSSDTLSLDGLDIFDQILEDFQSPLMDHQTTKECQASTFDLNFDFDESFLDDVQVGQADFSTDSQASESLPEISVGSNPSPEILLEAVSPSGLSCHGPGSVFSSGN